MTTTPRTFACGRPTAPRMALLVPLLAAFSAFGFVGITGLVPAVAAAPDPDLKFYIQGHYTAQHPSSAGPLLSFMSNETLRGVFTAFHEVNVAGGVAGGCNMTLKMFDDKGLPEVWGPRGNITAEMSDPSVLAAVTAKATEAFYVNPIARGLGMPVFGPTTVDQRELLQATPNSDVLVNVRLPIRSEGLAALNHGIQGSMHCKNFYLVFMDAFGLGQIAAELSKEIERLGFPAPLFVGISRALNDRSLDAARYAIGQYFAAAVKPTCVICMIDATVLIPFILGLSAALPPALFDDLHFFGTSSATLPRWVDPRTGSPAPFRNVYITSSLPSGLDTRYEFVKAFQNATSVVQQRGLLPVGSSFAPNAFAVDGYMAGRVLIEAVRRVGVGEQVTRRTLKDAVYRTRTFVVDDLILGPYSNGCRGKQTARTGACWCTSGMKQLFFSRVDGATGGTQPVFDPPYFPGFAEVPVPLTQCDVSPSTVQRPFIVITAHDMNLGIPSAASLAVLGNFSDSMHPSTGVRTQAVTILRSQVLAALKSNTLEHGPLMAMPYETPRTARFTNETLKALRTRYRLVFLMGATYDPAAVYPEALSDGAWKNAAFASTTTSSMPTLPSVPAWRDSDSGPVLDIAPATAAFLDQDAPWLPPGAHLPLRIPFYPALADFATTAAAYAVRRLSLGGSPSTPVAISVVSDSASLSDLATKSVETLARASPAGTFTAPASSSPVASLDAVFEKAHAASQARVLGGSGATTWTSSVIVVTRRKQTIEAAVRAAARSTAARTATIIAADEFVLEDVLRSLSTAASNPVPANVLFTSGLPRYLPAHEANDDRLSATTSYGAAIAGTVKALYDLAGKTNGTAVEIAAAAYRNLAVPVASAEISLSPLWADKCSGIAAPTWPHPGGECQCAKGLNTFFVHSLSAAAMNQTTDAAAGSTFSYRHRGCGPAFKALDPVAGSSGLSTTQLTMIAAGAAVVVLVVVVVAVAVWMACCQRSTRDNSNAPTDPNESFTMVFTDIQASTRLWAHAPDRMGEALDVHHKLLRNAIKKHKGYEVKTIGDSFMVAFKQAPQALRFAFDVQVLLYSYDLETDVFEKVYKDATAEAFGTDDVVSLRPGPLNADDTSEVSGLNTGRSLPAPEHVHAAAFSNPSSELPTPTNNGSETATAADSRYVVASHADPPPCAGALSPEDYAALWKGCGCVWGSTMGRGTSDSTRPHWGTTTTGRW